MYIFTSIFLCFDHVYFIYQDREKKVDCKQRFICLLQKQNCVYHKFYYTELLDDD